MGVFIRREIARTAKIATPTLWRGPDKLLHFFHQAARDLVCAIRAWNSLAHRKLYPVCTAAPGRSITRFCGGMSGDFLQTAIASGGAHGRGLESLTFVIC